jgi:hypothetical protein
MRAASLLSAVYNNNKPAYLPFISRIFKKHSTRYTSRRPILCESASLYRKKVLWKLKYFLACLFFCVCIAGAVSRGLGTATCKCARGIDVASGIWVDSRPQERIITAVDNNFKARSNVPITQHRSSYYPFE